MARAQRALVLLLACVASVRGWGLREAVRVEEVKERLAKSEDGDMLPIGPYFATCGKCAVSSTMTVSCKCKDGRGGKAKTSKAAGDCAGDEWLGNHEGRLECEKMPSGTPESLKRMRATNLDAARLAEEIMHIAWTVGGTPREGY